MLVQGVTSRAIARGHEEGGCPIKSADNIGMRLHSYISLIFYLSITISGFGHTFRKFSEIQPLEMAF